MIPPSRHFYPRPPRGGRPLALYELLKLLSNFYPRPPRGGRLLESENSTTDVIFLSTPSARRATYASRRHRQHRANFYPGPPRGGRRAKSTAKSGPINFYPRPPRGGRLVHLQNGYDHRSISIHALREEGDAVTAKSSATMPDFYPRPPRGGRRDDGQHSKALREDFYPRPPRGGRLDLLPNLTPEQKISIHALREEGDVLSSALVKYPRQFLSTPSARRATMDKLASAETASNFYPRPPRGGRQPGNLCTGYGGGHFYPRPPRGGRPHRRSSCPRTTDFYPRPPRGGRRPPAPQSAGNTGLFLSTPSARRATGSYREGDTNITQFLSTPSARRATRGAERREHRL